MPVIHVCAKCESEKDAEYVKQWGRTPETSGYGSTPKCVEIVTDPITDAGAVCGGQLIPVRV